MGALERARGLSPSAKLWLTVLLVAAVAVPGSFALDAVSAGNHLSTFSATALYWPSAVTATPFGTGQTNLAWTEPGNHGNGDGYAILAYDDGTANPAPACPTTASSYTFLTAVATGTTSYNDSTSQYGGAVSADWGHWSCYLVQTWYVPGNPAPGAPAWTGTTTAWTASGTLVTAGPVQIGFTAETVTSTNGGTAGKADSGDFISITYNQAATTPALTAKNVCFTHTFPFVIYIADTGANTCGTTTFVGALSGGSYTPGTANKDSFSTITAGAFTGNTLKVTLGAFTNGNPTAFTGSWTFAPSTNATSVKSTQGSAVPCTLAACLPPATLSF